MYRMHVIIFITPMILSINTILQEISMDNDKVNIDINIKSTTPVSKILLTLEYDGTNWTVTNNDLDSLKEAAGGGEITGQYAPTNDLLQPEEDPAAGESHVKVAQAMAYDEQIDKSRLDDITDEDPIPGEGNQYPQDDGKDDEDIESTLFDPIKVAETIVQQTMGLGISQRGVEKKGSLFSRDSNGKIVIPGLKTVHQRQQLAERERKIKELLK